MMITCYVWLLVLVLFVYLIFPLRVYLIVYFDFNCFRLYWWFSLLLRFCLLDCSVCQLVLVFLYVICCCLFVASCVAGLGICWYFVFVTACGLLLLIVFWCFLIVLVVYVFILPNHYYLRTLLFPRFRCVFRAFQGWARCLSVLLLIIAWLLLLCDLRFVLFIFDLVCLTCLLAVFMLTCLVACSLVYYWFSLVQVLICLGCLGLRVLVWFDYGFQLCWSLFVSLVIVGSLLDLFWVLILFTMVLNWCCELVCLWLDLLISGLVLMLVIVLFCSGLVISVQLC